MLYSIKLSHDSVFTSVNKDWCPIKTIHFLFLLDLLNTASSWCYTLQALFVYFTDLWEAFRSFYVQHRKGYCHYLPIWCQPLCSPPTLCATYMFLSDKHWQRLFLHWRTSSWVTKTAVSNMSKNQRNLPGWYLNFALNHVIRQIHTTQMSVGVMVLFCIVSQKGLHEIKLKH